MTQHTRLPWRVRTGMPRPEGPSVFALIPMAAGDTMLVKVADCDTSPSLPADQREGNAHFIVQACNTYEELLAALTKIATAPEGAYNRDRKEYLQNVIEWCQETARAAIAKASPQAQGQGGEGP